MTNFIAMLRQRLDRGDTLLCAWMSGNDPANAEILVREGFDTALFDLQHGTCDFIGATLGIAAVALAGKPALARIPVGEFQTASRLLDAGAAAIVAPMINSAAEALAFAQFVKYPPLGARSWGPARAVMLSGLTPDAFFAEANHTQLAIAMIETRAALADLEQILATPGIDGVLVGPADLSLALSNGVELAPDGEAVIAAMTHIAARAHAHGKLAAAFGLHAANAKLLRSLGYNLVSISTDAGLLRLGARAELEQLR